MRLVLFDIDGTLLHSKGVGSAATALAMREVFGTVGRLSEFRFGGKTDWQMLLETLDGLFTPQQIEARIGEYDRALTRHVAAIIPNFDVHPCVGAPQLLEHVLSVPYMTVGILTANMPGAAALKLQAAGYDPLAFHFGVYGSEAPARHSLAPIALRRAYQTHKRRYTPDQVVVIGDTPEDIACAKSIRARVIAVATGRYASAELAAHHPTAVIENMADTHYVWSLIMG